jgi:hypothetical protein
VTEELVKEVGVLEAVLQSVGEALPERMPARDKEASGSVVGLRLGF